MVNSITDPRMATDNRPEFWNKLWPIIITVTLAAVTALAASSYSNGGRDARTSIVEGRIEKLETNTVNKDQFQDVKEDVREIKGDIKDLLKQQRNKK